jgi:hypothetical protein
LKFPYLLVTYLKNLEIRTLTYAYVRGGVLIEETRR